MWKIFVRQRNTSSNSSITWGIRKWPTSESTTLLTLVLLTILSCNLWITFRSASSRRNLSKVGSRHSSLDSYHSQGFRLSSKASKARRASLIQKVKRSITTAPSSALPDYNNKSDVPVGSNKSGSKAWNSGNKPWKCIYNSLQKFNVREKKPRYRPRKDFPRVETR